MWLYIFAGAVLSIPILFAILALISQNKHAPGLIEGRLARCPNKPNCVCSEGAPSDEDTTISPFEFNGSAEKAWESVKIAIAAAGGTISSDDGNYLAATFSSPVFKFVDDLELRLDKSAGKIHVRSASRIGHSDLGANRKRVEEIRLRLAK